MNKEEWKVRRERVAQIKSQFAGRKIADELLKDPNQKDAYLVDLLGFPEVDRLERTKSKVQKLITNVPGFSVEIDDFGRLILNWRCWLGIDCTEFVDNDGKIEEEVKSFIQSLIKELGIASAELAAFSR
jgi:hypothetical protein